MRVIGIDPGTATTGFGVIDILKNKPYYVSAGVIVTDKKLSDSERLLEIADSIKKLIKRFKPQVLVLEKVFFSKNVKTAITVAQARGAILVIAENSKLKILECSPQDVKMSVTGYGRADKKQIQKMVQTLLNLKSIPKPDDAADALAAALTANSKLRLL